MARITVALKNDHLARLVRGPSTGLAELIWNALDADARKVDVAVGLTPLGAADEIIVTDDGHGMDEDDANKGFEALGGSWKKEDKVSRGEQRRLHGEQGQGRFAAFGLGERVKWVTVAGEEGSRQEIQIVGSRSSLRDFDISPPIPVTSRSGTQVTVEGLPESTARWLDRETTKDSLATTFAMYLESYPQVQITFRGDKLDPSSMQENRQEYELDLTKVKESHEIEGTPKLVIIEWNRQVERTLYLCNSDGMANGETKVGIQAPGSEFTAYLKWSGFAGHDVLLADLGAEPMTSIIEAARDKMREHFRLRAIERQRAIIRDWIAEGVYPYATPTTTQTQLQTAERQVFDVVAYAAAPAVNAGDKQAKRLSLRLLREAVETNPGHLHNVLKSVLELPQDRIAELSKLLERTTLSSVINTSKKVADRLDFLVGLDAVLFDEEPRKQTLERRQLHRILANETWLFGEEYALTGDDEALTKVLRKYLELLGEDVELADNGPVLRHDGTNPIPDLVLSRKSQIAQDRVEMLVIELKRPKVTIGKAEVGQIEEYALAVARDERFQQPNVTWDFWVIGNTIDEYAESRRDQVGLPYGYIQRSTSYTIQVRTWAEVINAAKHRLKFVEKSLNYQVSHDSGLEYLRTTHAKYLPPVLADEGPDSGEQAEAPTDALDEEAS
ncbi:ATP-binding protein [Lentzea sp. NPDC051838]|uniref:ATP-binding protein n=1 Tax=Lentzea sp. NPDC051838 TaxID=3154849 RepID=UPI003424B61F